MEQSEIYTVQWKKKLQVTPGETFRNWKYLNLEIIRKNNPYNATYYLWTQ